MTDRQGDRRTGGRTGVSKERAIAYMLSRAKNAFSCRRNSPVSWSELYLSGVASNPCVKWMTTDDCRAYLLSESESRDAFYDLTTTPNRNMTNNRPTFGAAVAVTRCCRLQSKACKFSGDCYGSSISSRSTLEIRRRFLRCQTSN